MGEKKSYVALKGVGVLVPFLKEGFFEVF